MSYEKFDRSKLTLLPLTQRVHDLSVADVLPLDAELPSCDDPALDAVAEAVLRAKKRGAAVIVMYGAHVLRQGNARFMIRLMEEGFVTHYATNGAGSIHDFEWALAGGTSESVAKYISEGQFGLWQDTGRLNDAVNLGAAQGLGFGESVGKYIVENRFPHADISVLAAGYRNRVPVTVHVGIGNDIVHEHPNCDGAAVGQASYTDFLIYTRSVENLEGGVFLNFGSAVTGPEVYLKALAMARNAAHPEGRRIADFTTAVFDLQPLRPTERERGAAPDAQASADGPILAPEKGDPRYYFRPWKTILARTVADGGRSYYVQGDHRATFGNLVRKILGGACR